MTDWTPPGIEQNLADELWTDDFDGDGRLDAYGNIIDTGAKEWRIKTFVLHRRDPQRKFCLVLDMARLVHGVDSHRYRRMNPEFRRFNLEQTEKEDLIEQGYVHPNMKFRNVAITSIVNAYQTYAGKLIRKKITGSQPVATVFDQSQFSNVPDIVVPGLRTPTEVQHEGQDWLYQVAKATQAFNLRVKNERMERLYGAQNVQVETVVPELPPDVKRKRRSSSRETDDVSDEEKSPIAMVSQETVASDTMSVDEPEGQVAHDGFYDVHTNQYQIPISSNYIQSFAMEAFPPTLADFVAQKKGVKVIDADIIENKKQPTAHVKVPYWMLPKDETDGNYHMAVSVGQYTAARSMFSERFKPGQ